MVQISTTHQAKPRQKGSKVEINKSLKKKTTLVIK